MTVFQSIPILLRADSSDAKTPRLRVQEVVLLVILGGGMYGGVMGSFGGIGLDRWVQILFSLVKVPLLLGVSFALTVPSFFLINTLMGMRADFRLAIRAVVSAQAGLAVTLASLAPFTALWYASCADYGTAIIFNGLMFALATLSGQVLLRRFYRQLIDRNARHSMTLRIWTVAYAFIAIQMAWVLRPFVGHPGQPTFFVRHQAWGNAYVVLGNMLWTWAKKWV